MGDPLERLTRREVLSQVTPRTLFCFRYSVSLYWSQPTFSETNDDLTPTPDLLPWGPPSQERILPRVYGSRLKTIRRQRFVDPKLKIK